MATVSRRSLSRWTWYSRNRYANVPLANSSDTAITATKAAIKLALSEANGRRMGSLRSLGSRSPAARRRRFAWLGFDEFVTNAPHRLDASRAFPKFFAQPGHVYVDRARIAEVVVTPGQLEQ